MFGLFVWLVFEEDGKPWALARLVFGPAEAGGAEAGPELWPVLFNLEKKPIIIVYSRTKYSENVVEICTRNLDFIENKIKIVKRT